MKFSGFVVILPGLLAGALMLTSLEPALARPGSLCVAYPVLPSIRKAMPTTLTTYQI
jgi:hypothetical protein